MFYFLLFSSFYRSMALVIASRDKSIAVVNSFMTSDLYHLETIRMDGGQEEKMYKTSRFPVI